jgi:hypothetical protein
MAYAYLFSFCIYEARILYTEFKILLAVPWSLHFLVGSKLLH